MQNQRESLNRVNSLAKVGAVDSNSSLNTAIQRSGIKQQGSSNSPPLPKPKVTIQGGRGVAPSPGIMLTNPAFSASNRSDFV